MTGIVSKKRRIFVVLSLLENVYFENVIVSAIVI